MRSGQNLTETQLTPANVNSSSFGLLRTLPADGLVDAGPLVVSQLTVAGAVHNVVYVATEHDSVYAYDADTGTALLHVSLLGANETASDARSCNQVSPEIGITSTPVIDRSAGPNGTLFVVAMSKDGSGNYYQRLHALDLTTLADRVAPVTVQATYPGTGSGSSGTLSFDPKQYKERGALLLTQGQIFTVWASHCDYTPYNLWIMAYTEASLTQAEVLNLTPNGSQGSLWDVAGLALDSSNGALYALAANGTFDTSLSATGFPGQQDYGNAAVRLSLSNGSLSVTDYFTPWDTVAESAGDIDLGSGSPLVLPDMTDAGGVTRHLLFGAGKDGNLYLLNRDDMGKYSGNQGSTNSIYQELDGVLGSTGLYSAPAYYNGALYVGAVNEPLQAWNFTGARLPSAPSSQTTAVFDFPGTSPSVSGNGAGNGIVWAITSSPSSAAILHAYNPANLAQEYYNSTQAANNRDAIGNGNKFVTPVVANGKVFVGTPNGVAEFGLL
jgi:hypothetical protein